MRDPSLADSLRMTMSTFAAGVLDPGAGLDSEGTERSFARGLAQDDSVCGLRLGCSIQAFEQRRHRPGVGQRRDGRTLACAAAGLAATFSLISGECGGD